MFRRVIFWNAGGLGWSIGKTAYLSTGSHWHWSGLDSQEPWQGEWKKNVTVECVGEEEKLEGFGNKDDLLESTTDGEELLNAREDIDEGNKELLKAQMEGEEIRMENAEECLSSNCSGKT